MTRNRTITITAGLMLSLFLASMESTVISTGMPTIVSQLGGLESYSWVFTAFMLASTTTVPIYGKLSDLFGRRPVYLGAMIIFQIGSILCGIATSMPQLIAFRAIQGLGAGGLMPLVFIIIGDLFTLEQRASMQGFFSSVWGVSSIVGPLLGGFLVDRVSWHWIFLINVVPGIIAAALVWFAWIDKARPTGTTRPNIDYLGALLLTAGAVALLMGLSNPGAPWAWGALVGAAIMIAVLIWVELRAADPILPISLFRDRMFLVACGHGLLAGCAMFGGSAFVPLFAQGVLGTSATAAGATLTPMMLSWVLASIIGSRLLLRVGYRTLALIGTACVTVGTMMLMWINASTSPIALMFYLGLMGLGMGLSIPSFLIAVQSSVERRKLGTATSTLQFSRSIGGALGIGIMGAVLSNSLASRLTAAGLDPNAVSITSLLDPLKKGSLEINDALRVALGGAIGNVFVVAFIAAAIGLAVTALTPGGRIASHQRAEDKPANQPGTMPE